MKTESIGLIQLKGKAAMIGIVSVDLVENYSATGIE